MKPILQAMLIADHVYQDKFSGKMIVAGIFSHLHIIKNVAPGGQKSGESGHPEIQPLSAQEKPRQLPLHEIRRLGSPFCYVNLKSLHGELPLELRYIDLEDNSVLMKINFSVKCDDPLKNLEIALPIPPLPAPHPGCYMMELWSQDELIGSHRITAIAEISPPEDTPPKGSETN